MTSLDLTFSDLETQRDFHSLNSRFQDIVRYLSAHHSHLLQETMMIEQVEDNEIYISCPIKSGFNGMARLYNVFNAIYTYDPKDTQTMMLDIAQDNSCMVLRYSPYCTNVDQSMLDMNNSPSTISDEAVKKLWKGREFNA